MGNDKIRQPVKKGAARVPVIMQMEALECGAACLAMVLAYYDKWIPLERVRVDCGVSRDGSKAKNIVRAAKGYGLTVNAYRMSPEALREKAACPCILHWNMNHFVVLNGFRGRYAYINDPAGCRPGGDDRLCRNRPIRTHHKLCGAVSAGRNL